MSSLVQLSDIQPLAVDWLWKPYLPKGMLSLLSGDPGGGKTYLSLAIAADLSNGRIPGTLEACAPVNTLYLSQENSAAHVIRPRFDLLGGDGRRLYLLQEESITLDDVSSIGDAIDETQAGLVIVDPIQSYLGASVDAHRSNETRPILDGLILLAEHYSCSFLLVRHLSKGIGGRAIHRGLGSIDFTAAARSELIAGSPIDDPERRVLAHIKSNVGPYGESLGYAIDEKGFLWTGKSDLTAADLISAEPSAASGIEGATDYLKIALAQGPRPQREIINGGLFGERMLQRAARKLGVKKTRKPERGQYMWSL